GVSISYSSGSIKTSTVTIQQSQPTVHQLLKLFFDPARCHIIEKQGKILVVPMGKHHITISGYVEDAASHERLIGASVYLPEMKVGTTTNKYGFYSITFARPPDSVKVEVTFIGYQLSGFQLSSKTD